MRFETAAESFRIATIVVFPLIIPVYIHDFLFDYFILRKRYILYLLCAAFLVIFFGYIIGEFQHYIEPAGSSETYGALLFMMILYTGARYFRIGTQQQMQLKEAEEKRIKVEMELKELEAKQSQAELNLLKSQVNPHFLFNSLNSIYSLILNESDIAADAVMKLSDLMRYLLESSKKRKVLVKHEFDFLQNYIDLEIIRLGKKAKVSSRFKGDFSGKIISPLLLIPFIENCFKHGIGLSSKDNVIDIKIDMTESRILLVARNNIAPQRINPAAKKSGTGIENVKKRLELLYPGKHDLKIETSEKEFVVNLSIEI
jgi:LytS/YehU family sensor histidine kinase